MNKMAKGALAIGVGAALLLGGGGTLATWNASQATNAGSIASGNLSLTAGQGVWQAGANPAANAAALPAGFKAVPGDTFSYTQDLAIKLEGTNMKANLTANNAVTKAFGDEATVAVSYTKDGAVWTSGTPLTGDATIKARITVSFVDKGAGLNNVSASAIQTKDLNAIAFKLEQIAPTTAP